MSSTSTLERFVMAQSRDYPNVLAELARGKKTSHWMWYIFPQIEGLGHSPMAREFAIRNLDEARRYLDHPILGPRLMECVGLVLAVQGRRAVDIFGDIDARKLRSCATLFAQVSPVGSPFHRLLDQYFEGEVDTRTLEQLETR
jgi:uncharacterized protein (DUF1810 family)